VVNKAVEIPPLKYLKTFIFPLDKFAIAIYNVNIKFAIADLREEVIQSVSFEKGAKTY
jgi:hypothetical protein